MQYSIALLLVALLATVSAFTLTSRVNVPTLNRVSSQSSRSALCMAAEPEFEPEFKPEDPKLFDMNRIVRLGRSRDQDGKSNIWSIEPKMVVEEDDEEDGEGGGNGGKNKNLVVGGIVIAAAIGALPLFTFFSKLVPDPSDF